MGSRKLQLSVLEAALVVEMLSCGVMDESRKWDLRGVDEWGLLGEESLSLRALGSKC